MAIDADFGEFVSVRDVPHAGLVRLPDVSAARRMAVMAEGLERHRQALQRQAVVPVRGGQIRIAQPRQRLPP